MTRTNDEKGPSWADVSTLIDHIEKQHKCRIKFEMGRKVVGKAGLVIDCVATRAKQRNDWYMFAYNTRYWPTHQSKTMPGLMIQQLWNLEELIQEYDDLPLFAPFPAEEAPLPPSQ